MTRSHFFRCVSLAALAMVVSIANATQAQWQQIAEGKTGVRNAPAMVWASDLKKLLLVGGETGQGSATIMAFDPAAKTWETITDKKPPIKRGEYFNISGRVAYSAKHQTIYAYAWESDTGNWGELFSFDMAKKEWKLHPTEPLLEELAFCSVVCDEKRDRLLIVGSDKRVDNVGYMRGVAIELATGKASTLPLPAKERVAKHQTALRAEELYTALIGRARLAWYRDPQQKGTSEDHAAIQADAKKLASIVDSKLVQTLASGEAIAAEANLLNVLAKLKDLRRSHELAMDEAYPVPRSRRDSPLAISPLDDVALLFGGDHLDYWMNDTWILDLKTDTWRRAKPKTAPAPQAGHAITWLPGTSQFAIYEGYTYAKLPTAQTLWVFDLKTDDWKLVQAQPWPKENAPGLKQAGHYYGYALQHYALPALAAVSAKELILEVPGRGGRPSEAKPSATWSLDLASAKVDEKLTASITSKPNVRLYRSGPFVTDFTDLAPPATHKPPQLDTLPANRWTMLAPVPFNSMGDERPKAWNSVVWDAKHDQILTWGGGHSVSPANSVTHYSPVSGRMVEGYDSESPYQRYGMGYGPYATTLNNRPWIPAHTYRLYRYDPTSGLMLFGYGRTMYYYDPAKMDWLKTTSPLPYHANYNHTLNVSTQHGMVVWTSTDGEPGLWIVSAAKGPDKLEVRKVKVEGKLPGNVVDREGLAYDWKRDRVILHLGGGEKNLAGGKLIAVSLRDGKMETLAAPGAIGGMRCAREVEYVAHADWLIYSENFDRKFEESKLPGSIYRIYDCAKDKWFLYDAGPGPTSWSVLHGLFYDAKRKLVFLMQQTGAVYALKIDPATAKLRDAP